jgi:PTS system nitrogen regulatory IIA component
MQITLRQAATYLGVDESTLRRWIKTRGLPAHRVNERLHLNAIEVWEWAAEHGLSASRRLLEVARRSPEEVPPLSTLLETGGIHRDVEGGDKSAVLAAIVERLPLSPEVDREFLLTVLDAREAMGSTGSGMGSRFPMFTIDSPARGSAVRHPVPAAPMVEFGPSMKPVPRVPGQPTVPSHLRVLAQLAFVLRVHTSDVAEGAG